MPDPDGAVISRQRDLGKAIPDTARIDRSVAHHSDARQCLLMWRFSDAGRPPSAAPTSTTT